MNIFLLIHIAGGLFTIGVAIESIRRIIKNSDGLNKLAKILWFAWLGQVLSGVLLLAQGGSIGRVCISGSVYSVIVFATEAGLYRRIKLAESTVSNK